MLASIAEKERASLLADGYSFEAGVSSTPTYAHQNTQNTTGQRLKKPPNIRKAADLGKGW